MSQSFSLTVNGRAVEVDVEPETPLLSVLRNDLGLVGSRFGCGMGLCGACFVNVDGTVVPACDTPMWSVPDATVTTVEGLAADDGTLHPLQEAFCANHGLQCGFCTPGMLTTLVEFLQDRPDPTEEEVRVAISGNLCRCTGYDSIVAAALAAARTLREALP